ncbi:MAG: glycine cleavage T C-terminal barrel domain-containing protein [Pseudomonadota bacterium]
MRVYEPDAAPLAIQGPKAIDVGAVLFGEDVRNMRPFAFREMALEGIPLVLARSGWSKQGSFELYLTDSSCESDFWALVKAAGAPWGIGPGAPNDVERIESGLISYGADMRWQTHPADPFEMGLGRFVDLDGYMISSTGRPSPRGGRGRSRVGVFVASDGVPGIVQPRPLILGERRVGTVSEIVRSRRLDRAIGIAMVETDAMSGDLWVSVADGRRAVTGTELPFIR